MSEEDKKAILDVLGQLKFTLWAKNVQVIVTKEKKLVFFQVDGEEFSGFQIPIEELNS